MCSPGSIIHKKLLMQNKTKTTSNPKDYQHIFILLHKMLASTIQFPNNNPITPTTTPHQKVCLVRLRPCAGQPEKTRTTTHNILHRRTPWIPGLLFQDPTVCQKTTQPITTILFQPASERTQNHHHQPSSHYLLIFHP